MIEITKESIKHQNNDYRGIINRSLSAEYLFQEIIAEQRIDKPKTDKKVNRKNIKSQLDHLAKIFQKK